VTTVIVVTIHIVVTIEIATTIILVCRCYINETFCWGNKGFFHVIFVLYFILFKTGFSERYCNYRFRMMILWYASAKSYEHRFLFTHRTSSLIHRLLSIGLRKHFPPWRKSLRCLNKTFCQPVLLWWRWRCHLLRRQLTVIAVVKIHIIFVRINFVLTTVSVCWGFFF